MKFSTLLFWLVLTVAMNFRLYSSPDKSESTVDHDLFHLENKRMETFNLKKASVVNYNIPGNHCKDIEMDIDVEHPTCDENNGTITGDPSYKNRSHKDCIRYALFKYNENGTDGDWIETDKATPEFKNLGPGKYAIKKYEDRKCNGGFDIDNCYQRFPKNGEQFIVLENEPCETECHEITIEIKSTDPQCGEKNGSIIGNPSGGAGACFKYSLYNYTKDRWEVEKVSSPEFYNLAPGKYRIKKYQDADCDGRIDQKDCYQPFPEHGYIELESQPCCYEKSGKMEFSGGSCNYPANFGLIKSDEGFDDGERKFIYLKVNGPVCCGEILVNPKTGGPKINQCNTDLRIAGPAALISGGKTSTRLSEIGTYDPDCVSNLEKCDDGKDFIDRNGNTIRFHGWKTLQDGASIWYYEVKSANKHAISHVTFALVESKTSCGPLNSLGSFVWLDENKNGIQDENSESGIPNVEVILYRNGVATGQSQKTNAQGKYLFTNLPDGVYQVKFKLPNEYNFTSKSMGNGQNDSKADPQTGMSDPVGLFGGEDYMFSDAGLIFGILPIILSDFSVAKSEHTVVLNWETASEINSDYFEVQRSTDGYHYQTITMVAAANNSSSTLNYSTVDQDPTNGLNFYRLKQVDLDGSYTYSDVRTITLESASSDLAVYPNPSTGQVTIQHALTGSVHGVIYNASGRAVREFELSSRKSDLNLQDLESGIYYMIIQGDRELKALKWVKQ